MPNGWSFDGARSGNCSKTLYEQLDMFPGIGPTESCALSLTVPSPFRREKRKCPSRFLHRSSAGRGSASSAVYDVGSPGHPGQAGLRDRPRVPLDVADRRSLPIGSFNTSMVIGALYTLRTRSRICSRCARQKLSASAAVPLRISSSAFSRLRMLPWRSLSTPAFDKVRAVTCRAVVG